MGIGRNNRRTKKQKEKNHENQCRRKCNKTTPPGILYRVSRRKEKPQTIPETKNAIHNDATVTVARFSVYVRRGVETVFAAGAFERPGLSNTSTTLEEDSRPDETDPPTKT
jgi:hypothetical protein